MRITAGIDVGANSVKAAVVTRSGETLSVAALVMERIRRRDMRVVVDGTYDRALAKAGLRRDQVDYVASTGAGEMVEFRTGHFYGMTSHARGAMFLDPETRTVLDLGAFHARAIRVNEVSRVLAHK
ncbi:MAG TPA: BadF/BadG/BcrA/BcrD ATPase family protein, partial [Candidatus Eisenbacteria bacterium]|nr:BadF/BadG/BcrA/BcrD ATPase family protein [Candidatus Eisenbacteria bacterium]